MDYFAGLEMISDDTPCHSALSWAAGILYTAVALERRIDCTLQAQGPTPPRSEPSVPARMYLSDEGDPRLSRHAWATCSYRFAIFVAGQLNFLSCRIALPA